MFKRWLIGAACLMFFIMPSFASTDLTTHLRIGLNDHLAPVTSLEITLLDQATIAPVGLEQAFEKVLDPGVYTLEIISSPIKHSSLALPKGSDWQAEYKSQTHPYYTKEGVYLVPVAGTTPFGQETLQSTTQDLIAIKAQGVLVAYMASQSIQIVPQTDGFWLLGKTRYRGGISTSVLKSQLILVNTVNMNQYLKGVVPKEMTGTWPIEALKAQAVAARTYALTIKTKHAHQGFDLCSTVDCQVYGGYSAEMPNSNMAVDQSDGQKMYYMDQLIQAYYHASSGGRTENSENVWSARLPYIRSVEDPYSLNSPYDVWTKTYSNSDFSVVMKNAGYQIGDVKDITIRSKSTAGRVQELLVSGTKDSVVLVKEKTRAVLGYTTIKSMLFNVVKGDTISILSSKGLSTNQANTLAVMTAQGPKTLQNEVVVYDGNSHSNKRLASSSGQITIVGSGFGHGLGMSQWGAKNMADQGLSYESILKHYYTGITLKQ